MVAGADTTAFTLTTGTIHILSNPKIYEKLVEALEQAIPKGESFPPLLLLEKIDYLVGRPVLLNFDVVLMPLLPTNSNNITPHPDS